MYKDPIQWQRIRQRLLRDGVSKRHIRRETGMHWATISKIATHEYPPGYKARKPSTTQTGGRAEEGGSQRTQTNKFCKDLLALITDAPPTEARAILSCISNIHMEALSDTRLGKLQRALKNAGLGPVSQHPNRSGMRTIDTWMISLMQGAEPLTRIRTMVGDIDHLPLLVEKARNGTLSDRNRAIAILAHHRGASLRYLARFLHKSPAAVSRYWRKYRRFGAPATFVHYPRRQRKADSEETRSALFSILHSPPSAYDINRTSWKLDDIASCLARDGISVSTEVIRQIIRSAGYVWRRAKIILASPDPEYATKLRHIQSILSSLGNNDRFCSIDEFGPFAIKMKGGRRLVAPNDYPYVLQFQKSKGFLILTAALELSRNQVTHFYSRKKNTEEMIKLLHVLLQVYRGCGKLYLSWDAASWHASKKLFQRLAEVNEMDYRKRHQTPLVEVAPLPKSAQFLNVIESVFSGMAKAIIHNSDYKSSQAAMDAIDRYYKERNAHFADHPRRAGKKIWGKERVVSEFSEAHNCKDPRWQ